MKKMLLLCGALLLVSASVAAAAGLNSAWDTCVGDGGTSLRTFACTSNANSGTNLNSVVNSFVPSADMPLYVGVVAFLDVSVPGGALPAWWGNACTGKTTPFSAVSGASVCSNDSYGGVAGGGGLAATNVEWNGPGSIQGIYALANAAGSEVPLTGGTEYFVGAVTITNAKTTGTGLCAGCLSPACINFAQGNFDELVNGAAVTHIIRQGDSQPFIYWQANTASCVGATPVKKTTWGSVKALYR